MSKLVILLIGIVFVAAVTADQAAWNSFKRQHNKHYPNADEEQARMKNFMDNSKEIAEHNKLYQAGQVSYEKGLNEFSDMTHDEFHSQMGGYGASDDDDDGDDDDYNNGNGHRRQHRQMHEMPEDDEIPKSVDWRAKGAVTSVDRQGSCQACWAFASNGALEAAHFIKTGKLIKLSAQNLIDCVDEDEKNCYWGNSMDAYNYISTNGGIDTDQSYPYKEKKDKCNYNSQNNADVSVSGFRQIPSGDEDALTHAVANAGPVTVAINSRLIQNYKGGVFHDSNCSPDLNHETLVVGYGTDDNDGDYYIIKNSYGTSWGENGFMKLARNKNNLCGISNAAGYPTV